MKQRSALLLVVLGLAVANAFGGSAPAPVAPPAQETTDSAWEGSFSVYGYVAEHAQDYVNPSLTADRGWLHLEARYNYEAIESGSAWIGYNFSFGKKLVFEITPMLGGVVGEINGVAPGYTITITYGPLELFTQGEYFFDAATRDGNFFYNASEFTCAISRWFRVGLALDRTKVIDSNLAIRRGPLVGFTYKRFDFSTYWLEPGSKGSTLVVGATVNF